MSTTNSDPVPSLPNLPVASSLTKQPPTSSRPVSESDADANSDSDDQETFHDAPTHFSQEDEAALLAESRATKSEANTLFSQKRYSEAISTYDRALASCPNYLDYEMAVLKSNISACHLQLEEWKAAVESATEALEGLDRLDSPPDKKDLAEGQQAAASSHSHKENRMQGLNTKPTTNSSPTNGGGVVTELPQDADETMALHHLDLADRRRADISRIRIKSLLRRARARHRQQPVTWAALAGAQEDYTLLLTLLSPPSSSSASSSSSDLATVRTALNVLPAQINVAKEKEMGEMMGKLKELGNGILKPFGLSTENFKMVKDEKTGGYSMNFEGGK